MRDLIRRLARPMLRLLGRDDRGAVGVLVGVLLGGGVLLGIGALVIDVGFLYKERAELQNGADAGALAVATSCARGPCTPALAATYANANARDSAAAVPLVCGRASGGGLGGCPASTGTMIDCPAVPATGNYVDVHTSTRGSGGATLLPPSFARALLGNPGYGGSSVKACARAAWGAPKTGNTFAMTISYCEWLVATGTGSSFAPSPPYPPLPAASFDRVLKLHTPSDPVTSCPSGPAGSDGPGQFGWTDGGGGCTTTVNNSTYSANTGVSADKDCKAALLQAWTDRTPIFIPIYLKVTGTGTGGTYQLQGFAEFVVTGYRLPSATASDWLNAKNNCKGADKCVNGFFTKALEPDGGSIGGGPNLGATVIALTG